MVQLELMLGTAPRRAAPTSTSTSAFLPRLSDSGNGNTTAAVYPPCSICPSTLYTSSTANVLATDLQAYARNMRQARYAKKAAAGMVQTGKLVSVQLDGFCATGQA